MIGSVLIANRGEIARRIIRTAQRLGVRTIAIYSEADADAPHVREANQAVLIGPPPARESYLDAERVLAAAKATDAEAIHPGYGFLSENAAFAEAVIAAGRIWVGPPPAAIRAMGLKDAAKRLMAEAGVPTTPGYLGDDQAAETLAREAATIGFPVLIKAVAGGGGKGMRRVDQASDFAAALDAARREAASSFGDDRVLLERYVTRPRHIEVQVFGDSHGNIVHLFERDCSLQRRHQKVVEEAPAPGMDAATRAQLCDAAVRAARAVNYVGAGTIEFIADASEGLRADRIWFMEMNTRLQVEHPVTEAITGLDLVEWQLRVASGEPLPLTQDQIEMIGHAMEARLYAEDPAKGFLPSTGRLDELFIGSPDIRVDSGVEVDGEIGPFYDPMIAKLIAYEPTREEAAERLALACGATEVWPVNTNAGFLTRLLSEPDFIAGQVDTGFIEARLERLTAPAEPSIFLRNEAASALAPAPDLTPWSGTLLAGFRLGAAPAPSLVEANGQVFEAHVDPLMAPMFPGEREVVLFEGGEAFAFTRPRSVADEAGAAGDGKILAPMPGRIASLAVAAGDAVTRGQTLVTLEAMKMEHALMAPFDGVVDEVRCEVGEQVTEGALLLLLSAKP
ncbi:MAG TPA: biotin carboxylase N-terminal domain-containing protein [Caulobacteraceae bacterium]|jgi:propionyl-CoA carboxylase alpha chain/3-methylcrotonyl-CoA carboxylase alpha subunit